jgi:hypothetical protein
MDQITEPTYPGRPAQNDLAPKDNNYSEAEESRLNASREAIRQRLNTSNTAESDHAQASPSEGEASKPINSWSSLLLSVIAPSAKKVAAKRPYTLIAGSALVGAYLVWAKPWRGVVSSVLIGAIARSLVSASINSGSKNGGRILRHYLNRTPEKKYPPYQKQEHAVAYDA